MSTESHAKWVWGVKIPLRDGTLLNATVYLPQAPRSPAPCVCTLTPYIADTFHERGVYFASQGLPFIIVDVRGRGNSEGVFHPFIQEGRDGHDVVEWVARQPYCNGKVGMWGGSYGGYCQWASAKEVPQHLVTIVPRAAPYVGLDFPMRNNIALPFVLQWMTLTAGRTSQANIFSDDRSWSRAYRDWHKSGRPFRDLDALIGSRCAQFQEWLEHPEPDAFWDRYNPTPEQYARLHLPILTITGSYDDDQPGALEHYKQHIRHAPPDAPRKHYLIIGPWDHLRTGMPAAEFGGVKFGAASVIDMHKLHQEWYAWTMWDGPKPVFLEKPVAYYVMGADRWRYAETLEAVTATRKTYFLDSTTNANDIFSSGLLDTEAGTGPPDTYRYDPCDPNAPEVDAEAGTDGGSFIDQSVTLTLRGKQLIYHSAPFEDDQEVSGFFRLTAWISIDCPDTDFYVSIHEIALDGSSIRLSTDALRARYRKGLRSPRLIDTRQPLRYEFDRFTFVSRQINRGHRLRLIIAPMGRLIEATFAQKNHNGGGVVADESIEDARAVTVSLFHTPEYPSVLYVPMGQPASAQDCSTGATSSTLQLKTS